MMLGLLSSPTQRILVTGSGGFLGTHLVARLRGEGADLYEIRGRADCDLRDATATAERIRNIGPRVIVHLAATPDIREEHAARGRGFANTVACAAAVVRAATTLVGCRIIHVGSYKQYGGPPPFRESDVPRPERPYGRAKLAAERLVRRLGAPESVCLRLGPVYGPGQQPCYLIPRAIEVLLEGSIERLALQDVPYEPLYIDDAIEAICRCLTRRAAMGRVINVGGGFASTPRYVVRQIAELMGERLEPRGATEARAGPLGSPGLADLTLARTLLDWEPTRPLAEGLRLTIDHHARVARSSRRITTDRVRIAP